MAKWGIDGYCWIPYYYLTSPDRAAEFWAIQAVLVKEEHNKIQAMRDFRALA